MIRKVFHDPREDRPSSVEAYHEFLVEASGAAEGMRRIRSFLESYQLVRYGTVEEVPDRSLAGSDPRFEERLDAAVGENRRRVRSLLEELAGEGYRGLSDLEGMERGPCSNTLHTVAHLVDGFFGIDSFFFCLSEGTHGISAELRGRIARDPGKFVLVAVRALI